MNKNENKTEPENATN